jgi:hypothetical protein
MNAKILKICFVIAGFVSLIAATNSHAQTGDQLKPRCGWFEMRIDVEQIRFCK